MISQTFVDFMDNYDTQAIILKPKYSPEMKGLSLNFLKGGLLNRLQFIGKKFVDTQIKKQTICALNKNTRFANNDIETQVNILNENMKLKFDKIKNKFNSV